MKDILKVFTKKRRNKEVTKELIREVEFPLVTEELVSLLEFYKEQMVTDRFFLDLSESGKYGAMCSINFIINKLTNIKDQKNNIEED